jgi:hypothetical protein
VAIYWLAILLVIGCAVKPNFPQGQALLRGETPRLPQRPDSVRSELELTVYGGGRKSSVSATFACIPRAKYKLDLYGLPGMVAASFFWQPEQWTLVIFDREKYAVDTGEHVEFGILGIREVSIHDAFSFLWGGFFPGFTQGGGAVLPGEFKSQDETALQYTSKGQRWTATLESATGLVRGVVREDSAFRLEYGDYKVMMNRPVPRKVRIFSRSDLLMEIQVKSVEDNPLWRRNPFFIKVPKGFQKLEASQQNTWKE